MEHSGAKRLDERAGAGQRTVTTEPSELALAADFAPPSHAQWQRLVAAVLEKSGADIPADHPERLLASTTYDGITLQPLYTAADTEGLPPAGVPGLSPFVRGGRPEGRIATGWDNRPLHVDPDPSATNTDILNDLENGANSVWLRVGAGGVPVDRIGEALNGVYVGMAPVVLDPGADYAAAADALLAVFTDRAIPPAEAIGTLGADPIGLRASTGEPHDLGPAAELAARVAAQYPKLISTVVDALPYHDAGGSDAQELGASIAAGVAYLRAFTEAGLTVEQAAGQLEFRYAATADQFLTIAKLRAARRLWARVCEASGVSKTPQVQHAVTSSAMLSRRDPWVNLLRGTVACFGAAVGGADAITVQPFDGAIGMPDAFSRRIARNTGSILAEESRLAGVIDPAGGSWYVERLTDELARAAWREFQEIESAGGIEQALDSGALAERLDATWQARASSLATRKDPLTGVSEFPHLDEPPVVRRAMAEAGGRTNASFVPPGAPKDALVRTPAGLPRHRYAEEFEALRDRSDAHAKTIGVRPRVFLATLGPVAKHTARASFAANLFAAGGIEPVNAGATDAVADVLAAYMHAKTPVACLCGTDLDYAEQADEVAAALKQAGATKVLLAGKPSDAYEGVSSPAGFVYQGCNAIEILTSTLDQLGVTA